MSLFATDEGGFKSTGKPSSSLTGLFDTSEPAGNSSLTYQAPIQPKKAASSALKADQMSDLQVLTAARVQGHKYDSSAKKYDSIGKIGATILGDKAKRHFQVILYHSNDKHVCAVDITPKFKFTVQRDTFGSFYDNTQNYSIQFANVEDCNTFLMHVALAKHIVAGGNELTTHDLAGGSGQALSVGDIAGVLYSGYVEDSGKLGTMFDSVTEKKKPHRITLGDNAIIKGWSEGVVGMKKGGRRVIVCPPHLAYGANGVQGKVPANATLVFHINVHRVKFTGGAKTVAAVNPPVPEDVSSPANGPSQSHKNDMMDRMRKIGQSAMPSPSPSGYDSGFDSPQPQQPQQPQQPYGQPQQPFQQPGPGYNQGPNQFGQFPNQPNQFGQYPGQNSPFQQQSMYPGQQPNPYGGPGFQQNPQQGYPGQNQLALFNSAPGPFGQQQPQQQPQQQQQQPQQPVVIVQSAPPAPAAAEEPEPPVNDAPSKSDNIRFLHEARQLHDDLKTTVVGACTKIEHLGSRIQNSVFGRDEEVSKERISGLVLIQTIQKIVEDNETLQKEVNLKAERIDDLREKLAGLFEKNKRLIEEHTSAMEERNDSLTETQGRTMKKIQEFRDEKLRLEEELNKNAEALSKARRELSRLNLSYSELTAQYKEAQDEVNSLRSEVNETKTRSMAGDSKTSELQLQLKEEKSSHKSSKAMIDTLKEELAESKDSYGKLKKVTEDRRKKWIQLKAQIDKNHEEEKIAAVKKMKAQLLKFKKARDAAIADAETTEKEVEDKWKAIIAKTKEQFAARIAELEANAAEDKQRAIDEAFSRGKRDGNKAMRDAKTSLEDAYKKGFLQGRAEGSSHAKSKRVKQLESQLERSRTDSMSNTVASLKKIMSSIYFQLTKEFDVAENYEGGAVVEQLAETIRSQTFIAVKQLETELTEIEDEVAEEDDDEAFDDDDMDDIDIEEQIAEFHKIQPVEEEVAPAPVARSAPKAAPVAVAEEADEDVDIDDIEIDDLLEDDEEDVDDVDVFSPDAELDAALAEVDIPEEVEAPVVDDYEDLDAADELEVPEAETDVVDDDVEAESAEEVGDEVTSVAEEEIDDEVDYNDAELDAEADDAEVDVIDEEEDIVDEEEDIVDEEAVAEVEEEEAADDDDEAEETEDVEVDDTEAGDGEDLADDIEEDAAAEEEDDEVEEVEEAEVEDTDDVDEVVEEEIEEIEVEEEEEEEVEEEEAAGQLIDDEAEAETVVSPAPVSVAASEPIDDIFGAAPVAKKAPVPEEVDIFGGSSGASDDLFGAPAPAAKKSTSKVNVNDLFGGNGGGSASDSFFDSPAKKTSVKKSGSSALDDIFGGAPAKSPAKKTDVDDIFAF